MVKRIVLLLLALNLLLMYYLFSDGSQVPVTVDNSQVKLKKSSEQLEAEYRLSIPDDVCLSVGPFEKTFVADKVMGELFDKGISNERRTYADSNNLQTNFVVYLPPFKNKMEAIKVERKLRAQGVRESYVISTGVNKDAVFLGIFDREDKARKQLSIIQELGYRPKLEPRQSARSLYWLDIRDLRGVKGLEVQNLIKASIEGLPATILSGNC